MPFSLTTQTCRSENSPNSLHTSPCTHPAQGRPQGPPVLPDDLPPRPAGGLPGDGRCHSTASIPFPSFTACSASATSDTILRSRSVILDLLTLRELTPASHFGLFKHHVQETHSNTTSDNFTPSENVFMVYFIDCFDIGIRNCQVFIFF